MQQNIKPERLDQLIDAHVAFIAWVRRLRRTYRNKDIATTIANQKTQQRTGIDIHEECVLPYIFQAEAQAEALTN